MIKNQFQANIQILHSDNGTEYFNKTLGEFLKNHGILHKSTCSNTPQQNGIAERKNRHILEVARALMINSNVPKIFWGDAVLTATYLIHRMPSRVLNYITPLTKFKEFYPLSYLENNLPLKIFGCTSFVHQQNSNKLAPRAVKCIFLGYDASKKRYKCYDPLSKRLSQMSSFW